jgi:hypothetical protein
MLWKAADEDLNSATFRRCFQTETAVEFGSRTRKSFRRFVVLSFCLSVSLSLCLSVSLSILHNLCITVSQSLCLSFLLFLYIFDCFFLSFFHYILIVLHFYIIFFYTNFTAVSRIAPSYFNYICFVSLCIPYCMLPSFLINI